jgi:hypothetical protein
MVCFLYAAKANFLFIKTIGKVHNKLRSTPIFCRRDIYIKVNYWNSAHWNIDFPVFVVLCILIRHHISIFQEILIMYYTLMVHYPIIVDIRSTLDQFLWKSIKESFSSSKNNSSQCLSLIFIIPIFKQASIIIGI